MVVGYEMPLRGDVMDDSVVIEERNTGCPVGPVVRRFSPVRIERMLLTRLFDLATGQTSDASVDSRVKAMPKNDASHQRRKEAA
jgi:hypothetical protein